MHLKRFTMIRFRPAMRRRLTFTTLSMINQILLMALAIAWIAHMAIIAANGAVFFKEDNRLILWAEIITLTVITVFAVYVLSGQIRRLGERRRDSERREGDRREGGRREDDRQQEG